MKLRSNKKSRVVRALFWSTVSVAILLIGMEAFARLYLGLGNPPLSETHAKIEYMFRPNQDVMRFGNRFLTNQYGMRSKVFPVAKSIPQEFRIMVFGDSVVNGGNLTDHEQLATIIAQQKLTAIIGRPTIVGNISAGSWGPGNWLAYAREYGFFDADIVILVASSHDYADNPTFQPLNPNTHPQHTPASALWEGITRYLPRYLPGNVSSTASKAPLVVPEADINRGRADLTAFLSLAKRSARSVIVLQHWEREEIENHHPKDGNAVIHDVCDQLTIPCKSLEPFFRNALEKGNNPYRDAIHPNALGQELIAEAILSAVSMSNEKSKPGQPSPNK